MQDRELAYQIGLSHSRLSSTVVLRLMQFFGSGEAIWEASEEALKSRLRPEQLERLCQARKNQEPERLRESYEAMKIRVLPMSHPEYPEQLRTIPDPPFILYVRGEMAVLHHRTLAIVGTRLSTDYGQRVVNELIQQIAASHPCIVSGLAAGIDTVTHWAALKQHLPTVAVFGTGIDQIYPVKNHSLAIEIAASGGALISEYPLGATGDVYTFPQRNRIIAGLCEGTLIVEGDQKSGALITAKAALKQGREVMAVPGNIFTPTAVGPNRLIQDGATPILCGDDICFTLGWKQKVDKMPKMKIEMDLHPMELLEQLSPQEREVLAVVGYDATSFEDIQTKRQHLSIMALQTALTMLELQGLVSALPGAKFCRN